MPLVFAYGANLDVPAMTRRCPRSRAVGPARLMRHRLAVMREGWLTVVRDARENVHGLLWDIALSDVAALDRFESVGTGLYRKILQSVATPGGPKRALVYVGANAGPGIADSAYIEGVIAAASALNLPATVIAALVRLRPNRALIAEAPRSVRPLYATPFDRP
jgi:gamma-glutamylcyclotransferase (GGCT)/AIG2-like uncharacterized protein YtfP